VGRERAGGDSSRPGKDSHRDAMGMVGQQVLSSVLYLLRTNRRELPNVNTKTPHKKRVDRVNVLCWTAKQRECLDGLSSALHGQAAKSRQDLLLPLEVRSCVQRASCAFEVRSCDWLAKTLPT